MYTVLEKLNRHNILFVYCKLYYAVSYTHLDVYKRQVVGYADDVAALVAACTIDQAKIKLKRVMRLVDY